MTTENLKIPILTAAANLFLYIDDKYYNSYFLIGDNMVNKNILERK